MRFLSALLIALCTFATGALSEDYSRTKLLEYPDPFTVPRVTARCVKEASAHVPCPTWSNPGRFCRKSTCIGHAYTTEALRVTAQLVISGPNSPSDAVRRAVQGIAAACGIKAAAAGKKAAAATPSAEPATRIGAAIASAAIVFKACIGSASATAIVGGIVRQLDIKVETPTHWARV